MTQIKSKVGTKFISALLINKKIEEAHEYFNLKVTNLQTLYTTASQNFRKLKTNETPTKMQLHYDKQLSKI